MTAKLTDRPSVGAATPRARTTLRRAAPAIAALLFYLGVYVAFQSSFGPILAALALAPVCAVAWIYGGRAGVVAGILSIPLDLLLDVVVFKNQTGFVVQSAPGYAVVIGTALFVGWASRVNARARAVNVELERLSRAQAEFVSVVSHEFRTPLTGIQGFSEMIRDDDLTQDEVKAFAADINDDARRLGRMISEMLDLDRIRSGAIVLHREPLDLNELIRLAATRLTLVAPDHPLRLDLDPALPAMVGDRDRLTQVVTNLVGNAVKYSPGGSEVTVATSAEHGGGLRVSVADHGMGIPAADLERVFEPYVRIASEATRDLEGTGLGLPIAREIVRLHGGRMWVESVVSKGSRFHFTLAPGEPLGVFAA